MDKHVNIDGIVKICKAPSKYSHFNAKENCDKEELIQLHKLFFEQMSIRQQDTMFIESNGHTLSKKIKIHHAPPMESKWKAIINEVVFDICYFDVDKRKDDTYLYLEKVEI